MSWETLEPLSHSQRRPPLGHRHGAVGVSSLGQSRSPLGWKGAIAPLPSIPSVQRNSVASKPVLGARPPLQWPTEPPFLDAAFRPADTLSDGQTPSVPADGVSAPNVIQRQTQPEEHPASDGRNLEDGVSGENLLEVSEENPSSPQSTIPGSPSIQTQANSSAIYPAEPALLTTPPQELPVPTVETSSETTVTPTTILEGSSATIDPPIAEATNLTPAIANSPDQLSAERATDQAEPSENEVAPTTPEILPIQCEPIGGAPLESRQQRAIQPTDEQEVIAPSEEAVENDSIQRSPQPSTSISEPSPQPLTDSLTQVQLLPDTPSEVPPQPSTTPSPAPSSATTTPTFQGAEASADLFPDAQVLQRAELSDISPPTSPNPTPSSPPLPEWLDEEQILGTQPTIAPSVTPTPTSAPDVQCNPSSTVQHPTLQPEEIAETQAVQRRSDDSIAAQPSVSQESKGLGLEAPQPESNTDLEATDISPQTATNIQRSPLPSDIPTSSEANIVTSPVDIQQSPDTPQSIPPSPVSEVPTFTTGDIQRSPTPDTPAPLETEVPTFTTGDIQRSPSAASASDLADIQRSPISDTPTPSETETATSATPDLQRSPTPDISISSEAESLTSSTPDAQQSPDIPSINSGVLGNALPASALDVQRLPNTPSDIVDTPEIDLSDGDVQELADSSSGVLGASETISPASSRADADRSPVSPNVLDVSETVLPTVPVTDIQRSPYPTLDTPTSSEIESLPFSGTDIARQTTVLPDISDSLETGLSEVGVERSPNHPLPASSLSETISPVSPTVEIQQQSQKNSEALSLEDITNSDSAESFGTDVQGVEERSPHSTSNILPPTSSLLSENQATTPTVFRKSLDSEEETPSDSTVEPWQEQFALEPRQPTRAVEPWEEQFALESPSLPESDSSPTPEAEHVYELVSPIAQLKDLPGATGEQPTYELVNPIAQSDTSEFRGSATVSDVQFEQLARFCYAWVRSHLMEAQDYYNGIQTSSPWMDVGYFPSIMTSSHPQAQLFVQAVQISDPDSLARDPHVEDLIREVRLLLQEKLWIERERTNYF